MKLAFFFPHLLHAHAKLYQIQYVCCQCWCLMEKFNSKSCMLSFIFNIHPCSLPLIYTCSNSEDYRGKAATGK